MTTPGIDEIETVTIVEPEVQIIRVVDETIHGFYPQIETHDWTHQGQLGRYAGDTKITVEVPSRWLSIRLNITSPPVPDVVEVDILRNGVSIFLPGMRPTLGPGEYTRLVDLDTLVWPYLDPEDDLTADVVEIGSVFPGADLVVTVRLESMPAVVAP